MALTAESADQRRKALSEIQKSCPDVTSIFFLDSAGETVVGAATKPDNWRILDDFDADAAARITVYLKRAGIELVTRAEAAGSAPGGKKPAVPQAAMKKTPPKASPGKTGGEQDDCSQLGKRCLADEALKVLARLDKSRETYRVRHTLADLAYLMHEVDRNPDSMIPALKSLDSTYLLEALAEIAFFGHGQKARAELVNRLVALKDDNWQARIGKLRVAAVAAAAGVESPVDLSAFKESADMAPAMMQEARRLAVTDPVGAADRAEHALSLRSTDNRIEYEALRVAFAMIRELAAAGKVAEAGRVAAAVPGPHHEIVGEAMLAPADPARLTTALSRARRAGENRNYPLLEIARTAALIGRGDIGLNAISAMSSKSTRQNAVIAYAAIGAATGDAGLVAQAQAALSSIPNRATSALGDGQIAIAAAYARLGQNQRAWEAVRAIGSVEHRFKAMVRVAGNKPRRFP